MQSIRRQLPSGLIGPAKRQRGVALFVVIVFVLLSMLLALWGSRTAWFNELVVGNDADYQRAFEAAQALVLDAELDIQGKNADGSNCSGSDKICRNGSNIKKFPLEATGQEGATVLIADLENEATRCRHGLCAKRLGRQDFWNYPSSGMPLTPAAESYEIDLASLKATDVGAGYGEYTGAIAPTSNPAFSSGRYWIEVLNYDTSSQFSPLIIDTTATKKDLLALNLLPAVVYRITALASGLKEGSTVVIQETYARTRRKD